MVSNVSAIFLSSSTFLVCSQLCSLSLLCLMNEPRRLHGGFTTYYPYPSSNGPGSGFGVQAQGRGGISVYSTYPFYLDDLWFYDTESGYWEQKRVCEST